MQYKKLRFVSTQNIEQGIDMIVVQKLALLIYILLLWSKKLRFVLFNGQNQYNPFNIIPNLSAE
jgi:hypothetical protein